MKTNKIIMALSTGITFGFIIGFVFIFEQLKISINSISTNLYLHYKMYGIIAIKLQEPFWKWLKISIITGILFILFWLIGKLILLKIIHLFIEEKKKQKLFLIGIVCLIFFLFFVWMANHFWLPTEWNTTTLVFDMAILILSLLLAWILMKADWKTFSKPINLTAITLLGLLLIGNLGTTLIAKKKDQKGPNVILIVVDTLRADHLSCYGYIRKTTPNIDNLSLESIFFKNAISAAPWTTPSIASILTSQYPSILGIESVASVIDDKFTSIAEIFQDNGYTTKGIISHAYVSSVLSFDQGFQSFDEENVKGEGHVSSPSITQKAISFIEAHKDDKYFLFLHYFDPHFDFILHEDYNYYPDYDGPIYSGQDIAQLQELAPHMTTDDIEYLKALYDSEISFTDEYIGKLINRLKELNLYDNTLIAFTADHGEEFSERGDHHIGHTKTLYQELIHIPFIIKLPENSDQHIVEEPVGLIDLVPSIIDYAGLKMPKKYEYEGEVIDMNEMDKLRNKEIFSETKRMADLQSITLNGWKSIKDHKNKSKELFRIIDDPRELSNLAQRNIEKIKEMDFLHEKWIRYINLKKPKIPAKDADFNQEQKEILRSLGYIR